MDHLLPLLDSEGDSALLADVGSIMAQSKLPDEVLEGIKLGRFTALGKPDGGVRTVTKQVAKKAEKATALFQYALTTKAGCECVAHILQTITDGDERTTVVSIDGCRGLRSDLQERDDGGTEIRSSFSCSDSMEARRRSCGRMKWASHQLSWRGGRGGSETPF